MKRPVIMNIFTMLLLLAPACAPQDPVAGERGGSGKADGFFDGSCDESCGMQASDGQCYCDAACHGFGDCCGDKIDQCGLPDGCDGAQGQADCDPCGEDGACNPSCGDDPDCPSCIADGECDMECESDPDCPDCGENGECNTECDADPDCPDCSENGECNAACDADPDCPDGGQLCDTSDDCEAGECVAGLCRLVSDVVFIETQQIDGMAVERQPDDTVEVRANSRGYDYFLSLPAGGAWTSYFQTYDDYLQDRWQLRAYRNPVTSVASFAYSSNRSVAGPVSMSYQGSRGDFTFAFDEDGAEFGATADHLRSGEIELRLWTEEGSEVVHENMQLGYELAVRFRTDGQAQVLGFRHDRARIYDKVDGQWSSENFIFPTNSLHTQHLATDNGTSWAVAVGYQLPPEGPNAYVFRFSDDSAQTTPVDLEAHKVSPLRLGPQGDVYALLRLYGGGNALLRIDSDGNVHVSPVSGTTDDYHDAELAILSDGTIVIVYGMLGDVPGFSYQIITLP